MEIINTCKSCNSKNLQIFIKDVSSFGYKMDVVECKDCHLRFRNILLNEKEIESLYASSYFNEIQKDYFFSNQELKEKIFKNRLQIVNSIVSKKGTLLDVGSAMGTFLEVAKKDGWKETGIEVSEYASEIANKNGLNSICGNTSMIIGQNKKYDVITLWDMIDHAEKPLTVLDDVRKLIGENGFIFVETTVIDSAMFIIAEVVNTLSFGIIKNPLLKGYPVHHTNYYSQQTMAADIEKAGFKVVKVIREPFNQEIFSGTKIEKILFGLIESFSKFIHKEIVCTIVAVPK